MRHVFGLILWLVVIGCGSSASEPRAAAPTSLAGENDLANGCFAHAAPLACNPLTNAGCQPGEACGDDDQGGFRCYPPPNDVELGGDCNIVDGPSCKPGLACNGVTDTDPDGRCDRLCCSSADCGGKACEPFDAKQGTLGTCAAQ